MKKFSVAPPSSIPGRGAEAMGAFTHGVHDSPTAVTWAERAERGISLFCGSADKIVGVFGETSADTGRGVTELHESRLAAAVGAAVGPEAGVEAVVTKLLIELHKGEISLFFSASALRASFSFSSLLMMSK